MLAPLDPLDPLAALPCPRDAHAEMLEAVLAGEGLERVAEIAAAHAGAPVAIVVGEQPERPGEVVAAVPIVSGGRRLGAVLMTGDGRADASVYLYAAAVVALTAIAVADAGDDAERRLGGSFLEELLMRDDLATEDIVRRAGYVGCDLRAGAVGLCGDPGDRPAGRLLAAIATERPDALAQAVGGRVYALLPGDLEAAQRAANRLARHGVWGISSHYRDAGDARQALEEAELMLDVGAPAGDEIGSDTFRLLFRVLASHPEEMRRLYENTIGPIARHDEQYSTDLVATLGAYLHEHNCNMNLTAKAIYAHRHTVSHRLERVHELTGLNPFQSEDRERLGLGLKALRVVERRQAR